ncbi:MULTISPECIES: ScpA family protein [Peptoniphilus]|uniref:segregation and condensation protein A n=1 Tax=Peptoniphilus TaxID=162289 RepID=UPI000287C64C|nr:MULTISPECIES: segregation/condensation protein A [Peptoniphilus]MBS6610120.1 segregation/condensation protein A [Peptoniphilus harei]MDU1043390.1 segregation/condensation protein A [Peptoniphilus rhinitidis]MDU1954106.1 segregation/condensation protein A [Peptoniphilus lacydonensis]MDU2109573.1 segregation/condensation protein A [Peptoniphilus lacydonensis]MDU3750253.1 segregation/condensation protein A [Peptoniphilus rhinitidis]
MEYNIVLKTYEGPMDLLLDLIKENEIDIYDIPIFTITEEFLRYIENMKKLNLTLTSDFILMASTLLEIKSKMLLPKTKKLSNEDKDEEDPRKDLVESLLEYKKYKEASEILKIQEDYESKSFYKLKTEIFSMNEMDFLKESSVDKLSLAFFNILKKYKDKEIVDIDREYFKVEDASRKIKQEIIKNEKLKFSELLIDIVYKVDVITYFLGMLELIKNEFVIANQRDNFGDILIEKRKYNGQEQVKINN